MVTFLVVVVLGIVREVWIGLKGQAVSVSAPETSQPIPVHRTTGPSASPGAACDRPLHVVTALALPDGLAPAHPPVPTRADFPASVEVIVHWTDPDISPQSLGEVPLGSTVDLGALPCNQIAAFHAEYEGERVAQTTATKRTDAPLYLGVGPLQRITLRVEDALTGEPVRHAWSPIHGRTAPLHSDADGEISWWRPTMDVTEGPDGPRLTWTCSAINPEVHAEDYISKRVVVPGCDGAQGRGGTAGLSESGLQPVEVTVQLESGRTVFVHCTHSGRGACPGDLTCTPSWSVELTKACTEVPPGFDDTRQDALRCGCPFTDAVVRGLGRSYAVPDDAEDIWIDLEDAAGVRGQVADMDGRRHSCQVVAERVAADLADVGSLGAVGRVIGTCDDSDGQFQITGLAAGDWVVEVTRRAHERGGETEGITLPVAGLTAEEVRDLGAVDVTQGAALEVDCEDGLTGESTRAPMLLLLHDSADFEVGYVQVVSCGHRQDPALSGDWTVFVLPWAHVREHVYVASGDDVHLALTIGDDDAMDALGGALEQGDGSLVVREVAVGGELDTLGFQPGDELVDITAFGVPLPMDDYPEIVLSGVLGIWGTAGIEVAVRSAETGTLQWKDLDP